MYFFSKEVKTDGKGEPEHALPAGYELSELVATGLPILKKIV